MISRPGRARAGTVDGRRRAYSHTAPGALHKSATWPAVWERHLAVWERHLAVWKGLLAVWKGLPAVWKGLPTVWKGLPTVWPGRFVDPERRGSLGPGQSILEQRWVLIVVVVNPKCTQWSAVADCLLFASRANPCGKGLGDPGDHACFHTLGGWEPEPRWACGRRRRRRRCGGDVSVPLLGEGPPWIELLEQPGDDPASIVRGVGHELRKRDAPGLEHEHQALASLQISWCGATRIGPPVCACVRPSWRAVGEGRASGPSPPELEQIGRLASGCRGDVPSYFL